MTGASTGMGAATARELARRGFYVLAGVRRDSDADALRTANIEPVLLDITRPEQVQALADRISADPDRRPLRALINNAGIGVIAPVEALPIAEWRRQFEVNLFGHVAVTQALMPALLASSGRVVNISSLGGKVALPAYGAYAGTKFALEAVSDALRREVAPLGVQVVIVEPGGVRTEMNARGAATARDVAAGMSGGQSDRYGQLVQAMIAHSAAFTRRGLPAEKAALVIAEATTARHPRTRYTIGRDAALLTRLARIVPDRLLDRILAADLRPYYSKGTRSAQDLVGREAGR